MTSSATPIDLRRLRHHVETVVAPGDDGWDSARHAWNLAVDQHPAAVVFPRSAADVQAAVSFAGEAGLRVAVQSTGHGAARLGPLDGALLLRTTQLRGVHVDAAARRARVEAGASWSDVVAQTAGHGLAGLSGSSGGVGVAGYTLGGGLGWLGRRHGLACNAVTAIEAVDGTGTLHRASATEQPELFWALRGGGGTFAVVTALEFALFPATTLTGGTLIWPAEPAPRLLRAWRDWCETAPAQITTILRYLHLPELPGVPELLAGKRMLTLGMVESGDGSAAAQLRDLMRAVSEPLADDLGPRDPAELATLHGDPEHPVPGLAHHRLLGDLPDAALDALDAQVGAASGSGLISAELRQLGGALAEAPEGAGVASTLGGRFLLFALGAPSDAEHGRRIDAELDALVDALAPYGAGREYPNFAERAGGTLGDVFPATTVERLASVKHRFDPANVLLGSHPVA